MLFYTETKRMENCNNLLFTQSAHQITMSNYTYSNLIDDLFDLSDSFHSKYEMAVSRRELCFDDEDETYLLRVKDSVVSNAFSYCPSYSVKDNEYYSEINKDKNVPIISNEDEAMTNKECCVNALSNTKLMDNRISDKCIQNYFQDHKTINAEKKPKIESIKKVDKSFLNSEKFPIYLYISNKLQEFINSPNYTTKNKGRPRLTICDEKIKETLDKWAEELCKLINSGKRSDFKLTSYVRKVNKVIMIFAKMFCCKSDYKSKNLKDNLDSYLVCFFYGFLKMLQYPLPQTLIPDSKEEYDIINLFIHFCVIKFPSDRVTLLLNMFNEDSLHHFNYCIK